MVVAVGLFELLHGHPEPACGLPMVCTLLHQPSRCRMTQRVPDHIVAKPRILKDAFPGRPDLARKRLAVVHSIHDKTDLLS